MGISLRRMINQMLEINSRGLGYPPWDLSGRVKDQFNVTAVTGGDIISSNVQVRGPPKVARSGQTYMGRRQRRGSSSPGPGTQPPTITSKMGTAGGP